MHALWDGRRVTQGIAETKGALSGLATHAKSALGALGIGVGIYQGWTALRGVIHGVAEEATAFERLQSTINRRGGATASTIAAMNAEISRLATTGSTLEDTQIAQIMRVLVETSGDAAGSVEKLAFAMDLAAAKQIDYERAAKITGFLMKGQIDQATRFAPEIKELAQNFGDLKGTTELSAKAFEALSGVIGASEDERGTAMGNVARLKRGVGELGEALFKAASGGTGFLDFLGKVGDAADKAAAAIEKSGIKTSLGGGIAAGQMVRDQTPSQDRKYINPTWWWPFDTTTAPHPMIPGATSAQLNWRGWQIFRSPQSNFGNLDPSLMNQAMNGGIPWWFMRDQGPTGFTPTEPGKPGEYVDPLADMRMWAERLQRSGRAGGIRGSIGGTLPFADRLKDAVDPETILDAWIQKNEQIAATIADPIAAGIAQGAVRGSIDFKSILQNTAQSLIQSFAQNLFRNLAFRALTGGFSGGGLASFAPNEPLIPVGSMDIGLGGVSASMARNRELRGQRLG